MTGHTKPRHYFGLMLVWKDLARPATLRHHAGHHILNLARLPVPPLSPIVIIDHNHVPNGAALGSSAERTFALRSPIIVLALTYELPVAVPAFVVASGRQSGS